MAERYSKASFESELAGHGGGVIGAKPAIDDLIRACGFTGTQETIPVVSLTQVGGVATAEIGAHTYQVGNKFKLSGADQAGYNGVHPITAKTATTISFAVAGGLVSPATGEIVMDSAYVYTPISENIPSVAMRYNADGVLHKIPGAKGTLSVDLQVKSIPKFKFEFTGLNTQPVDDAQPLGDFSKFTIPQVANTQNTTGFSLLGYAGALQAFNLTLGNTVTYKTLIGREYVEVLDRKATGSATFEAPTVAQKDYWKAAADQETGTFTITHGSQHGNKVEITCPRVLLDSPKYQDSDNVMMLNCGVSIMPVVGNDEITITFK